MDNQKIKIFDNVTDEELYEYEITAIDQAYTMASQMEELGLDIRIYVPTISDTLKDSLRIDIEGFESSCSHKITNS